VVVASVVVALVVVTLVVVLRVVDTFVRPHRDSITAVNSLDSPLVVVEVVSIVLNLDSAHQCVLSAHQPVASDLPASAPVTAGAQAEKSAAMTPVCDTRPANHHREASLARSETLSHLNYKMIQT